MIDLRLVFIAVVVILGANVGLAIRDSEMMKQIDQQNAIIERMSK
jgi:hypothetical protein